MHAGGAAPEMIRVYVGQSKHTMTMMELWDRQKFLRHIVAALGRGVLVAVIIPLAASLALSIPFHATLALIASGLIIEYGAVPVGIALGLSPLFVSFVLICTETGIFLALYDIFDTIGHTYEPVMRFLEKSRQYVHQSKTIEKYGILALFPSEILLGVYVNAPASWVLGWREDHALLVTMIGYIIALAITVVLTVGLLQIALPGLVQP
jgi:uncharacterized membrane protein